MIVACRLGNGLDIGGFVLRGNRVSPDYPANAPGRERIAGFEITRNVPSEVWEHFGARAQFESVGVVFGSEDEQELTEWCWANARSHGHANGAPQ